MGTPVPLYPLLLNAALHTKVWGGRRLATLLHKSLPGDEPYGESWELHDTATVANGALAGRSLGDLLAEYGHDLVGARNNPADGFPLLAKFLDAAEWLSIQVHPDDEQARQLEGEPRGKSEAWIILYADPGAQLVIGVQPGTTRDGLANAIRSSRLEQLLVRAPVKPGDIMNIPAGTIHALGPGLVIYEIQQSSDTTYRLYDWGRMGLDGKPRALHIDKGVQVANLDKLPTIEHPPTTAPVNELIRSPFFVTQEYHLEGKRLTVQAQPDTPEIRVFHALTCLEGEAVVSPADPLPKVTIHRGQTVLMPAVIADRYDLQGTARILCSYQA